jgi:hypothetical protein
MGQWNIKTLGRFINKEIILVIKSPIVNVNPMLLFL